MHSDYLVIDTNILISGLLFPKSNPNLAVKKALLGYTICVSQATFDEFLEVSARPKFAKYFSIQEREEFIANLLDAVKFVEIKETITDCQDLKDNKFLEVAISAKAKYLVTGDKKDLLSMNPYRNVEIISVSEFLAETR
ncbi:putative toxin-antitoxin system toxin component, PIN family [Mannheimia haemolytica]|uniref:putative toxin-antitoxin system toxin component, PIN family n=1 Tax=Mannheimia haemolytica TaxID=75985 RepID=UPI000588B595|nr:putative toxin-antitoxin system toxin component, PIN family [Mannheimia haemolytica]AJE07580.1 putative toxin-antitoxin system toxin component, PIN family [Mannheimia haemolytica USDA-ARS-USMARC-184]UQX63532.1 putative toxin-antitoxin system toxin component, PIN family [Mannheimia haemolytica]